MSFGSAPDVDMALTGWGRLTNSLPGCPNPERGAERLSELKSKAAELDNGPYDSRPEVGQVDVFIPDSHTRVKQLSTPDGGMMYSHTWPRYEYKPGFLGTGWGASETEHEQGVEFTVKGDTTKYTHTDQYGSKGGYSYGPNWVNFRLG